MTLFAERNRIYLLLAAVAALALLAVGWAALASAQGEDPGAGGTETTGMEKMEAMDSGNQSAVPYDGPSGIWVNGTGRANGAPDIAVVSLGVEAVEDTAAAARASAAAAMRDIMTELLMADITPSDIQTRHFNISPRYQQVQVERCDSDEDENGEGSDEGTGEMSGEGEQEESTKSSCYKVWESRLLGYAVSNQASVKIRNLASVGSLIDRVVEAGGDLLRVNGIRFDIDDPQPLQDQARANAVSDLKRKAEMLADLSGVKLGRLVYLNEGASYSPPQPLYARAEAAFADSSAGTQISGGELEFSITLQGVFLIAGEVEDEESPEPEVAEPPTDEPQPTEEPEAQGGNQ